MVRRRRIRPRPRLPSLRDVNRRVVAVVSVAVITGSCVFAFAAGQLRLFERGYEMSGVFSDTGGLRKGDDVRVAGVKVGRVTSVEADFGRGNVIIAWTVARDVRLGRTTRADVQTATLLGGRYVKLSGPVGAPYLADLPSARRRVPLERTSVPFTITDSLNTATRIAGGLDQKAVDKLLDETAKIKIPTREKLGQMLRNFDTLATTLNDRNPEIRQLIANSKKITGTLAAKDAELVRIINASKTLLDELVKRRNELARTIGEGNRIVRTLSQVITEHSKEINSILGDVHLLTQRLAPNMDALNEDLALLGPTFRQVANSKGEGRWIEGLLTGLGPIQPPGPVSQPKAPGGDG
ncbi:MCE family protein [Actinomadura sp. HBU206391]|uniref:MCE family protein n=1 Tax=Actinomadura sp. HBU206391 TaxID=2731692 RepID=UPI00165017B0|nr:MlaD family protein [Actinomadura sp. HBU206391]MBC6460076.1 MCE family protein [Actinomadura sp. HBU206391]